MNLQNNFFNIFKYKEKEKYEFILPNSSNDISNENFVENKKTNIYPALSVNLEILNEKYNLLINSDIKIRKFSLPISGSRISAALLYIDGMVNEEAITNSVLQPLLLKNSIEMKDSRYKIWENFYY